MSYVKNIDTKEILLAGDLTVSDLANGTDGELITWDAAGAPATVAVGTINHVLTSNGAGAAPTFQASGGSISLDGAYNNGNTIDVDGSPVTMTVSDTDNNSVLDIIQNDTTNDPNAMNITNSAQGNGLVLTQSGVLDASKYGMHLYSNAAQVNSPLLFLEQDNAASTANVLEIQNDGTGTALSIENAGVSGALEYPLFVHSNATQTNSSLAFFHQEGALSSTPVLTLIQGGSGDTLVFSAGGTQKAVIYSGDASIVLESESYDIIFYDGNRLLSTYGADFKLSGATAEWDTFETNFGEVSLLNAINQAAAGTSTLQQVFDNGQTITIADTDNQTLAITQNDTTNDPDAVTITNSGTGTALDINQTGILPANDFALHVRSTAQQAEALGRFEATHASGTGSVVEIHNAGSGANLALESTLNVAIIQTPSGTDLFLDSGKDIELWSDGSIDFRDSPKSTSGYSTAFVLSDTAAEWNTFETNFGEVSLINSINQAYGTARVVEIVLLDDTTDTAVADGVGDITFTVPEEMDRWDLTNAQAAVEVAGTTGTTDIQIHNVTQAVDMLTTKITIDSGEPTSYSAATPPVIDTANDDVDVADFIRIDVDAISTTAAKGLKVMLTFKKP